MYWLLRLTRTLPLALALAGRALAAGEDPAPATIAALADRLSRQVGEPRFARASWGIQVLSLDTGRTLFATNEGRLFIPASTAKLFTGALALHRLGPDFRIRTSLYAKSRPDAGGRLRSDLIVFGRGDPSFDVAEAGGDWDRVFAPLVAAVRQAGVSEIRGNLVADATCFCGPSAGSGWEHDDLPWYYGAPVSALTLNNNAVDVIVRPAGRAGLPAEVRVFPAASGVRIVGAATTLAKGGTRTVELLPIAERGAFRVQGELAAEAPALTESVAVPEPAGWFGERFKAALDHAGIRVRGQVVVVSRQVPGPPTELGGLVELGSVNSPPLRDLLPRMLKPSQNLHAQLLLLQVGVSDHPAAKAGLTSEQAGLDELQRFTESAGLALAEAHLEEGSGLSRHNLVTPHALVQLLRFMAQHPQAVVFESALPVAGVDGTLRTRFRGTAAEGNVRAKTGSLSQVSTLAGFLRTAAGERLAFALLLNNYFAPSDRPARIELDEIAILLAGLRQHSRELPPE